MTLSDILRDLEADALPDAASRFHAVATDYFERSRDPAEPRPVPRPATELARLFDEPLVWSLILGLWSLLARPKTEAPAGQSSVGASKKRLATAYSPTTSQWQYHRRCRA